MRRRTTEIVPHVSAWLAYEPVVRSPGGLEKGSVIQDGASAALQCAGDMVRVKKARPAGRTGLTDSLSVGAVYVRTMMGTMQVYSINRKTINWISVRFEVLGAIPAGANVGATFSGIRRALTLLGDNHSVYRSASGTLIYASTVSCSAPTVTGVPIMGADVGYVRIPPFVGRVAQVQALVDTLQSTIRAADGPQVRGWIVDLRGNSGGNMWPMIAGVGPILGTGIAGYFIDPDGRTDSWGYNGVASQYDGYEVQRASAPYTLVSASPKAAVLIDQLVASSGEAVAVAFKQRPCTRFFGSSTCGASTANRTFQMSDGALLALTVSVMADRTDRSYGGPLQPDEVITDMSVVLPRAVAWLRASAY